ncbi:YgaP family membrane protein [Devosia faecipullorum]|uniref:YgaP family membrane protein n=1 Tax=Devosia faecipullorum TaxID=2755039 RepID=UPI00187B91F6|nr:DUF2892 domain-containing protein [Devosia faecipullorum]MBE7734570.1 DUF2892 domain-containing protein [Devosia faecipullorum]
MTANVGSVDRLIRLVLGLVLVVLPFTGILANPVLFWGALVVGVVLIATAAIRFCPLYRLFGLSTGKASHR